MGTSLKNDKHSNFQENPEIISLLMCSVNLVTLKHSKNKTKAGMKMKYIRCYFAEVIDQVEYRSFIYA